MASLGLLIAVIACFVSHADGQQQGCTAVQANTNYCGDVLVVGKLNKQLSAGDCCTSCRNLSTCNVWVYCPNTQGCDNHYGTTFGYQECTLKTQANPANPLVYERGPSTAFSSGVVLRQSAAGYPPSPWLHVEGSDIRVGTERWFVRGVNIPDPRSCGRCSPNTPAALDNATNEVICRMRVAVNTWKVQAFRLAVYTQPGQNSPSTDAAYVSALAKIVKEATENLNVYVIVGVQLDPSNDPDSTSDADAQQEIPNAGLVKVWQSLVPAFAANPRVLFGISNEPHCPWNDSQCQSSNNSNHDVQVRNGMATVVRAIRAAEFGSFSPYPHIILAQGCRNYAADISCYSQCGRLSDPQVAYEVHVYNAPLLLGSYDTQIFGPARNIPIVIGEIGPQNAANHKCPNKMTFDNLQEVLQVAEVNKVPYFGWTFHSTCVPNMLTSAAAGCNSCQQNINNILPIDDGIVPDVCGANWGCFAYKWLITSGNKTAPEGQSVSCKSFSRFPTAL